MTFLMSIVIPKQRRTIGLGEVSSLATSPNLTPRLCQAKSFFSFSVTLRHTSKKRKSLRILLFRPKKSAEKVRKSSWQNFATKVRKSIKFNDFWQIKGYTSFKSTLSEWTWYTQLLIENWDNCWVFSSAEGQWWLHLSKPLGHGIDSFRVLRQSFCGKF